MLTTAGLNSKSNSRRVNPPRVDLTSRQLKQIVVVIPALNEAESLPGVLNDLPEVGEVIVVDNGSTDDTAEVACQAGATVLHEAQRGYGAACHRALVELRERSVSGQNNHHIVVFLDADHADDPTELEQLVRPILDERLDLVIGSRTLGPRERGALLPQARFGNWLACWLLRILLRFRYSDLGPFRAIRYASLRTLNMLDRGYGWTIEMQIKAVRTGLKVGEVPVSYRRRRTGRSKISGTLGGSVRAGMRILITIFRYALLRR